MTPLHLQMLLWHHTRAEPYAKHEPDHAASPVVAACRRDLLEHGLIEPDPRAHPKGVEGSGWTTTAKGRAYVDALCSLPFPVCKWIIPNEAA